MTEQRPHTAQELYRFAMITPSVMRNLERSFVTLNKYGAELDTDKATRFLMSNVKAAAQLYVQVHGLHVQYWLTFPRHEREGCAALFLRRYDSWRAGNGIMLEGVGQ